MIFVRFSLFIWVTRYIVSLKKTNCKNACNWLQILGLSRLLSNIINRIQSISNPFSILCTMNFETPQVFFTRAMILLRISMRSDTQSVLFETLFFIYILLNSILMIIAKIHLFSIMSFNLISYSNFHFCF